MSFEYPLSPPPSPSIVINSNSDEDEEKLVTAAKNLGTVGIWMNDSKYSKLPIKQLSQYVNICRINSIAEASECTVILHKVLDKDVIPTVDTITSDLKLLNGHPGVLYPLENICLLNDRYATIEKLRELVNETWNIPETVYFEQKQPLLRNISTVEDCLNYPVIAKPISACSDPHSHTLHLLSGPEQLQELPPGSYILQRFIHHSGLLLKIYLIGDSIDIILKASLTQTAFSPFHAVVFDSQSLKKLNCRDLTGFKLEQEEREGVVRGVAREIQRHLGLGLLGVDVIVEEGTGRIFVVDVNYFPGYSGVKDLSKKLLSLLLLSK